MGQAPIAPLPRTFSLRGKTAIVTGSNTGLGLEIAHQLLQKRLSHLIIAVRTVSKGEAAADSLRIQYRDATITVEELDLQSFKSVRKFVESIKRSVEVLDVLVLNAGATAASFKLTEDRHESVIQVNHYSNAALIVNLLPLIKKCKEGGRITVVGSAMFNKGAKTSQPVLEHTDNLVKGFDDSKNFHDSMTIYQNSKFLSAAFVEGVAEKEGANKVTINYACPGFLKGTGLDEPLPMMLKGIVSLLRRLQGRSVPEGAKAVIHSIASDPKESHGRFMQGGKVDSSYLIIPDDIKLRIFEETMDLLATEKLA